MQICYISYCPEIDYPRVVQFQNELKENFGSEYFEIIIQDSGLKGIMEIITKLVKVRSNHNPDKYILGFRGNEIFFAIRLLTLFKPLYFDSFVPFWQAFYLENKWNLNKIVKVLLGPLVWMYEWLCLMLSHKIIVDTHSHKEHYIKNFNFAKEKIWPIYLGCPIDIDNFKENNFKENNFTVFFYATMQPLHGLEIILKVIEILNREVPNIKFVIAGGNESSMKDYINLKKLRNVEYYNWLAYGGLIENAIQANICLGGPFGGTSQANNIITGKTFLFLKIGKCTIVGKNKETKRFDFLSNKNCILVNQNSVEDLYQKIVFLYENPSVINTIEKNSKIFFQETFSKSKIKISSLLL